MYTDTNFSAADTASSTIHAWDVANVKSLHYFFVSPVLSACIHRSAAPRTYSCRFM